MKTFNHETPLDYEIHLFVGDTRRWNNWHRVRRNRRIVARTAIGILCIVLLLLSLFFYP